MPKHATTVRHRRGRGLHAAKRNATMRETLYPETATICKSPVVLNASRSAWGNVPEPPSKRPIASADSGSGKNDCKVVDKNERNAGKSESLEKTKNGGKNVRKIPKKTPKKNGKMKGRKERRAEKANAAKNGNTNDLALTSRREAPKRMPIKTADRILTILHAENEIFLKKK